MTKKIISLILINAANQSQISICPIAFPNVIQVKRTLLEYYNF